MNHRRYRVAILSVASLGFVLWVVAAIGVSPSSYIRAEPATTPQPSGLVIEPLLRAVVPITTPPAEPPGLVIRGHVRLGSQAGPGLGNVTVYRSFAAYAGTPVATTDAKGYYQSGFQYIPGDENVTVWAEKSGFTFEPPNYFWRHYYGYESRTIDFVASFTPTAFVHLPYVARQYAYTATVALDVALVLDISDSLANGTCSGGDYPCIHTCATADDCRPFQEMKQAALAYLDSLSPNIDRVTVIPFALFAGYCINIGDIWPDCAASAYDPVTNPMGKYLKLPTDYEGAIKRTSNITDARSFIASLDIAIPEWAGNPPGYPIPPCPGYSPPRWDPRQCTNTNIGAGIRAAATELLKELDPSFPVPGAGPNHPSTDHVRVIVLLADGAANASGLGAEGPTYGTDIQLGFCPQSTWYAPPPAGPFCRVAFPGLTIATGRHISTSAEYDAVDYLLDWSDFVMLNPPRGNGIVMFTLGLGDQVINASQGDPSIGEKVLRYIAAGGDDGDLATDPCGGVPVGQSCGNYYYAPDSASLPGIVSDIAARIRVRLGR